MQAFIQIPIFIPPYLDKQDGLPSPMYTTGKFSSRRSLENEVGGVHAMVRHRVGTKALLLGGLDASEAATEAAATLLLLHSSLRVDGTHHVLGVRHHLHLRVEVPNEGVRVEQDRVERRVVKTEQRHGDERLRRLGGFGGGLRRHAREHEGDGKQGTEGDHLGLLLALSEVSPC